MPTVTTDLAEAGAEARAPASPAGSDAPSELVRAHVVVATVFLVFGVVLLAAGAIALAVPGAYGGVRLLSYGRLVPLTTTALLYGWLTIGLVGAIHHVLPRLAGRPLVGGGLAILALMLLTLGTAVGMGSIYLGASEGRIFQEPPWWADALLLAGFVLTAWVATATAARARGRLGPAAWYLVGATWWLTLVGFVGALPGVPGYAGVVQGSFYRAGFTGAWLVAAAVGIVYYLVPRLAGGDPLRPTPLGALGFWSLALVWAATGPRDLVYGAGPDWLETLGVAAALALVVPVAVIVTDVALQMRGRWRDTGDRVAVRFVIAGGAAFLLVPFVGLIQAARTTGAVVQFTTWVPAFDLLVILGVVSMWLFAFVYHGFGAANSRSRREAAIWHLRYSLLGLFLLLVALWAGGIVVGLTWASGANSGLFVDAGEGFFRTAARLRPSLGIAAVGAAVYALAQGLFVVAAFSPVLRAGPEPLPAVGDPIDLEFEGGADTVTWSGLRWGVVGSFLLVATIMWLLPSLDPANAAATILAEEARVYPAGGVEAAGRAVYVREGCAVCHTQEVRAIVPDVGLGPVSVAGDYAYENPVLRGSQRLGPDLMHVGSRPGIDAEALYERLVAPRATRPWSYMPSYASLSPGDLDALVRYLLGLE